MEDQANLPSRPRPNFPDDADLSIGGNCPVQGEGEWLGRELYFRARGGQWSLTAQLDEGSDLDPEGRGLPKDHGQDFEAWGMLGNAGWVDEADAAERCALHLWAWSLSLRELGTAGDLVDALLAVDPLAARAALSAGASANDPAAEGAPSPLALALGLFSQESRVKDEGADPAWEKRVMEAGEEKHAGLASMARSGAALQDDGRDGRRLACVKALLEFGADPNAPAPGWALSPLDWAARLPSGEPGDDHFGDALGGMGAAAKEEAREKRPGRLERNPCFALMDAGADPWARAPWREAGEGPALLESLVDARAMGLAQACASRMGEQALWSVAWGWIARLAREEMTPWSAKKETPAKEAVAQGFSSGAWPSEWIERAQALFSELPSGGDAQAKAIAWAEEAALRPAAQRADSARARFSRPSGL
jgi:hypothetical protein